MNAAKINQIKTPANLIPSLCSRTGAVSYDVYVVKGKRFRASIVESFFKSNGEFHVKEVYKVEDKKTGKTVFAGKKEYKA